ncbi:hypothetical protein [Methylobacterium sp. SI9]|uniref:hypothetical protein n=1 Tax=Methylobacterium guangdongense TaxID=3138811 RepID=UPI00313AB924
MSAVTVRPRNAKRLGSKRAPPRHSFEIGRKRGEGDHDRDSASVQSIALEIASRRGVTYAVAQMLRSIAKGFRPDQDDLAVSPMLVGWWCPPGKNGVLKGIAFGHPTIVDGSVVVAKALVMDSCKKWVWDGSVFWCLNYRISHN